MVDTSIFQGSILNDFFQFQFIMSNVNAETLTVTLNRLMKIFYWKFCLS